MVAQRSLIRWILSAAAAFAFATHAYADNYLWEVSSLTAKVYLYGTVHAGKREWYPLPSVVENALIDSSALVVEADITNREALRKSAATMTYTPPDELKAHVPPDQYARLLKLLPRYAFTEADVSQVKPFVAVSLLVFAEWARSGFIASQGVDGYLIRKAVAETKPILELEGAETQVKLMDSLPEKQVQDLFKGTLDALEEDLTTEQIKGLVAAWQDGNPGALLEIARRYNDRIAGAKEFEERFIWERHADMLKKIEGWLSEPGRKYFIAVGALHLAGPRGLVELLRKRGYVVRQL
jgi:uncharacterized protein YbaP (TraB family)